MPKLKTKRNKKKVQTTATEKWQCFPVTSQVDEEQKK